jgi:tripeptide aminopeptidase
MTRRTLINEHRLVETFLRYIAIDSTPMQEEQFGSILAQDLAELGCTVDMVSFGQSFNMIARLEGSGAEMPWLLMGAHMDTVESTASITYVIEDGVIKTNGSTILGADNKSAIAQIIEAIRVIREQDLPHAALELLFTASEERGLLGARNLNCSLLKSRYGILLDVSGPPGSLVVAAPTREMFVLTVKGRAAHAGIEPEAGINAVLVAAEIAVSLPSGRLDERTTMNISEIRGGSVSNIVPEQAAIYGEYRAHDASQCEAIRRLLHETPLSVALRTGATVTTDITREYEGFALAADEPFLLFGESILHACGLRPKRIVTGGGSDGNILNQQGICCLNFSNGMSKIHSHEEYISIADLVTGCELLLHAAEQFPAFAKEKCL